MKKSKLIKLLVSALSLCLIVGAMVGITAFADDGDETNPTVEVVAQNVSYGDQLYLYYAVYAENVGENFVKLKVCDANGELRYTADPATKPLGTVGAAAGQYTEGGMIWLKNSSDELKLCYVFVTSGVAAKEINTVEIVKPVIVDAEGNEVVSGENKSYSVEDYLYTKLYDEGYAIATADKDDDGLAIQRRTLYYSMIKYGATAQALLAPDATDIIADTGYFQAPGSNVTASKNTEGYDKVYLDYDLSKVAANEVFVGWNVLLLDKFGNTLESKNVVNGSAVDVGDNFLFATPIIEGGAVDFSEGTKPSQITEAIGTNNGAACGTITYTDGAMTLNKTGTNTYLKFAINSPTVSNANANAVIVEMDMTFDVSSAVEVNISASGGGHRLYPIFGVNSSSGTYYVYNQNRAKVSSAYNGGTDNLVRGEKVRFRYEYYEATSNADARLKIYADGTLIGVFDYPCYDGNATTTPLDASAIKYFSFNLNYSTVGTVVIDNLSLIQTVLENSNDPVGVPTVDKTVIDFDNNPADGYMSIPASSENMDIRTYASNGEPLLYINDKGSSSATYNVTKLTKQEANATVAALEFDFKMISHNGAALEWGLRDGTNSYKDQTHLFYLTNSGRDTLVMHCTGASATKEEIGSVGEWIHVRMEYSVTKVNTYGEVIEFENRLIINDKEVYSNGTLYKTNVSPAPTVSEICIAQMFSGGSGVSEVMYDNIKFEQIYDEKYVPTTVEADDNFEFVDAGETFEGDINPAVERYNNTSIADVDGNKVLQLTSDANGGQFMFHVNKALRAEENAKYSVLSFNINLAEITADGNFEFYLYSAEDRGSGIVAFPYFYLYTNGSSSIVDLYHNQGSVSAGLKVDEWVHVDIVIDHEAKTWTYAVDGTVILTGDGFRGDATVQSVAIYGSSGFMGRFYIDNLNFVQVVEAPALTPAN